jgi:hypothetical protein
VALHPYGLVCESSSGSCAHVLPEQQGVLLIPAVDEGSVFGGWQGVDTDRGIEGAALVLTGDRTVVVTFNRP